EGTRGFRTLGLHRAKRGSGRFQPALLHIANRLSEEPIAMGTFPEDAAASRRNSFVGWARTVARFDLQGPVPRGFPLAPQLRYRDGPRWTPGRIVYEYMALVESDRDHVVIATRPRLQQQDERSARQELP